MKKAIKKPTEDNFEREFELNKLELNGKMLFFQSAYEELEIDELERFFDENMSWNVVFAKCYEALKEMSDCDLKGLAKDAPERSAANKKAAALGDSKQMKWARQIVERYGIEQLRLEAMNIVRDLIQLRHDWDLALPSLVQQYKRLHLTPARKVADKNQRAKSKLKTRRANKAKIPRRGKR